MSFSFCLSLMLVISMLPNMQHFVQIIQLYRNFLSPIFDLGQSQCNSDIGCFLITILPSCCQNTCSYR